MRFSCLRLVLHACATLKKKTARSVDRLRRDAEGHVTSRYRLPTNLLWLHIKLYIRPRSCRSSSSAARTRASLQQRVTKWPSLSFIVFFVSRVQKRCSKLILHTMGCGALCTKGKASSASLFNFAAAIGGLMISMNPSSQLSSGAKRAANAPLGGRASKKLFYYTFACGDL